MTRPLRFISFRTFSLSISCKHGVRKYDLSIPQHDGVRRWSGSPVSHIAPRPPHTARHVLAPHIVGRVAEDSQCTRRQDEFVGPRPHAVIHNEGYRKLINGDMIRHKVRPGITGCRLQGVRRIGGRSDDSPSYVANLHARSLFMQVVTHTK